jgi:hypothetical protein
LKIIKKKKNERTFAADETIEVSIVLWPLAFLEEEEEEKQQQ